MSQPGMTVCALISPWRGDASVCGGQLAVEFEPVRLLIATPLDADVVSYRVELDDAEAVELLLVSPTPAMKFSPESLEARRAVRGDVVVPKGGRLLIVFETPQERTQVVVLGLEKRTIGGR